MSRHDVIPIRRKVENLLGAASMMIQGTVVERLKPLNINSGTDAATLVLLLNCNALTISGLAVLLSLEHSSTVRVTDRLVKRKLVVRAPDPADARVTIVHLTAKGTTLAKQVLAVRREVLASMVKSLATDDLQAFGGLLASIMRENTDGRESADRICRMCDETACGGDDCPVEQAALACIERDESPSK